MLRRIEVLEYEVKKLKENWTDQSYEIGISKELKFTVPDPDKKSGKGGKLNREKKENSSNRRRAGGKALLHSIKD